MQSPTTSTKPTTSHRWPREAKARGCRVYDSDGQVYLDAIGGYGTYNLGRAHPRLAGALAEATARRTDQGNFPLISLEKAALAESLARFVGGKLSVALFGVTRGESMDAACKAARGATGRAQLLTVDGGSYGQTGFALSLSARRDKDLYGPLIPEVGLITMNDPAELDLVGGRTAAVVLEPMQAENGCRAATADYLRALRRRTREVGALLIIDETQTGFGRTGHRMAFQAAGIEPDILVLGESLGGGMFPITATLLNPAANAFMSKNPLVHLSTFGGHDAGCRVALAALETYERIAPWEAAAASGELLGASLRSLARRFPRLVRRIAGAGLLFSLTMTDSAVAEKLIQAAVVPRVVDGAPAPLGLLIETGRVATDSVVLRPSLLMDRNDLTTLVGLLESALTTIQRD